MFEMKVFLINTLCYVIMFGIVGYALFNLYGQFAGF